MAIGIIAIGQVKSVKFYLTLRLIKRDIQDFSPAAHWSGQAGQYHASVGSLPKRRLGLRFIPKPMRSATRSDEISDGPFISVSRTPTTRRFMQSSPTLTKQFLKVLFGKSQHNPIYTPTRQINIKASSAGLHLRANKDIDGSLTDIKTTIAHRQKALHSSLQYNTRCKITIYSKDQI
jgi:hypothetical protein